MSRDHQRSLFLASPLAITIFYSLCVIGFSSEKLGIFVRMVNFYAYPILIMWLTLGVAMLVIDLVCEARRRNRRTLGRYFGDIAKRAMHPPRQIIWLTPPLVFILLMAAYGLFKQLVIPASGYWAGPMIMAFEHGLLLDHHAWEISHALLPTIATHVLDQAYGFWLILMVVSMLICSYASGDPLHRCRFMLCFIATWIIAGSALAYLLPASGPIYFSQFQAGPDPFVQLKATLLAEDQAIRAAYGSQLFALQGQSLLLDKLQSQVIFPGGGISAMPSMHNAIAILLACAGFSVHRIMGWALSAFAAMIFIGSIHLGWHYALDGVVAAIVSGGLWLSSAALLRRYEHRIGTRRTALRGGRRISDQQQAARP